MLSLLHEGNIKLEPRRKDQHRVYAIIDRATKAKLRAEREPYRPVTDRTFREEKRNSKNDGLGQ